MSTQPNGTDKTYVVHAPMEAVGGDESEAVESYIAQVNSRGIANLMYVVREADDETGATVRVIRNGSFVGSDLPEAQGADAPPA